MRSWAPGQFRGLEALLVLVIVWGLVGVRGVKGLIRSGAVVWTACLRPNQTGLGPLLTHRLLDSSYSREAVSVQRCSLKD